MAVAAATVETYDNTLIFEDLQNAYSMISSTECPFQQAVPKGTCDSTNYEWPVVDLAAVDPANRVIEGDDAPPLDNATLGKRLQNYTQISDKTISVSHTSDAVDAAADNIQKIGKQIYLKMKEIKRDKEVMFLENIAALPASSGTARQMAGFAAFIRTNTVFGATGADPTLSGTTEGYPNAAATNGTPAELDETKFNDVVQQCWEEGGDPTLVLVNANNKRIISETFVGNATRYKDTVDQKVINSIDFYESDFGTLTIVPTRFMYPQENLSNGTHFMIPFIDPNFVRILYLEDMREKPLAETGHSRKRLLWCEYTLQVDNEKAHGMYRDTDGIMPA